MEVQAACSGDKRELYAQLTGELRRVLGDSPDEVSAMANASALLKLYLDRVNWVGFYRMKDGELILGPFQGKPAVTRIPPGKGVCGEAALEGRTRRVADVHACDNHIVCDPDSASEIVVPLTRGGEVLGVLDIDSPVRDRFDDDDRLGLEAAASLLAEALWKFRYDNVRRDS